MLWEFSWIPRPGSNFPAAKGCGVPPPSNTSAGGEADSCDEVQPVRAGRCVEEMFGGVIEWERCSRS